MTKPIIVVKVPCKLLYVIQVKEFLIKCSTSWPYLISEFLVAYITIVASDWPRTFFTPKVFLFSIYISNKTLGEWRMLRSHLGLSNDDEVANFLLNRYQQESRGDDLDPVLKLEYKMYKYKLRSQCVACWPEH